MTTTTHTVSGRTSTGDEKQDAVLDALATMGTAGLTSREMAEIMMPGDVSAMQNWGPPFTRLREKRLIAGLKNEKREKHHVHVLVEHLAGRTPWWGYKHHCPGCTCGETAESA